MGRYAILELAGRIPCCLHPTEKIMKYYLLSMLFFFSLTLNGQNQKFSLEDMNRLVSISSLQISPDGKAAIFMVSQKDMQNNRTERDLIYLDLTTREQQVIGKEYRFISAPTWAPDGSSISLIAPADGGLNQVYLLRPKTGASLQITDSENGVVRYAWAPNGTKLAFLQREKRPKKVGSQKFNNAFEAGNNDYLVDKAPLNTSVWLYNVQTKEYTQVTPQGFTVATGLSTSGLSWSADDRLLAFTRYPSAYSGDSDMGRNFVYNLVTGQLQQATANEGMESSPLFGPDSKTLLFRYPREGFPSNMTDWHEVNLNTGKIDNLTGRYDRSISSMQWLKDGSMLMRGIDDYGNVIYSINGGKSTQLNMGDLVSISSWSSTSDGTMVLTGLKKDYPVEVYYKAAPEAEPVALTNYNSFVNDRKLGQQEGFSWKSKDGLTPNGIITYPPDFDPEKKYPLVLQIHGGPSSASLLGFSPVPQTMAAKGWIVFQPNYRGSTNLGNAFQSAISRDPSEGPGHDVIMGVNALKEKPYVDGDKVAVSGWSYGGWMTSWLIGRYPEVWSAAVAGAAPVDVTDMYSLNDLNKMKRHSMPESPYVGDNMKWAFENSPISNFSKIKAPTLIMSKTGDTRVTITGSYKLHGALRDNGIPVQFIAYPGSGHFPRDPVGTFDVYTRWIKWIEKYVGTGPEATIEAK